MFYRSLVDAGAAACLSLARKSLGFLGIGSGSKLRSLEEAFAPEQAHALALWPPDPSD
jgi:hypothetical protein